MIALAILTAIDDGRAEITCGCAPSLRIDGLCVCDQGTAYRMARDGLLRPVAAGATGEWVRAELTDQGRAALKSGAAA